MISSFDGDLRALIDERNVGFNHLPGDAEAFIDFIVRLAGDENLRRSMATNAASLYRERFDAEANIEVFTDHIESVAMRRRYRGLSRSSDNGAGADDFARPGRSCGQERGGPRDDPEQDLVGAK